MPDHSTIPDNHLLDTRTVRGKISWAQTLGHPVRLPGEMVIEHPQWLMRAFEVVGFHDSHAPPPDNNDNADSTQWSLVITADSKAKTTMVGAEQTDSHYVVRYIIRFTEPISLPSSIHVGARLEPHRGWVRGPEAAPGLRLRLVRTPETESPNFPDGALGPLGNAYATARMPYPNGAGFADFTIVLGD